jgi:hypothetical protein
MLLSVRTLSSFAYLLLVHTPPSFIDGMLLDTTIIGKPAVNGYGDGYQTCNVLALALDPPVVPPSLRSSVLQSILDDITKNGNHLTTG